MQLTAANQVGVRESLADLIVNAEADATPYIKMAAKRKKPGAIVHDWQIKVYPNGGHGGVPDGKDATDFRNQGRDRVHGVAQKMWYNPAVSDFAEENVVAGAGGGEMAAQVVDAWVAIGRMQEKRCLSNNDCLLQAVANPANETRGLFSYSSATAQAQYPVPDAYRPGSAQIYSGALSAFKEATLIGLCKAAYKVRKGPARMKGVVGIDLKTRISEFSKYSDDVASTTSIRKFDQEGADKAIIGVVDHVTLDTGTLDLMVSSFLYTNAADGADTAYTHRSGVFFEDDMSALYYTRLPNLKKLPYAGGGEKAICDTIFIHGIDNTSTMCTALISTD